MRKPKKLAFGIEPSDRAYRLRLARYPAQAEAVTQYICDNFPDPNSRIDLLDIGTGRGRSLRYLEATGMAQRINFYGMDIRSDWFENIYAKDKWTALVTGDVEKGIPTPPLPPRFHVILCEQVLEHVTNPASVMSEMAKAMQPGGLLIVGVPTFPPGIAWVRKYIGGFLDGLFQRQRGHVQTFSCGSLVRMLEESGPFQVIAVRGFRIISGGPLAPLENLRWWWKFNSAIGRLVPLLCTEVQVITQRKLE
jgi:SAM-dependent methyltransferase